MLTLPAMPPSSKPYPILIFCDGACSGNPGPGGWGVIVALPTGEVRELGGRDTHTTNNRMEILATIRALEWVRERAGEVVLCTDSTYVIRGITQWIWGWRSKGWKTAEGKDVLNVELWKALSAEVAKRGKENPIEWKHVRGHAGIAGNERVDQIAVAFAQNRRPSLYDGPLLQYGVAIHDLPEGGELPEMRPKVAKVAAHSYLSLIGDTAARHSSWAECERRVKGQSGAKFKKAMSADEEQTILESWGVSVKPP